MSNVYSEVRDRLIEDLIATRGALHPFSGGTRFLPAHGNLNFLLLTTSADNVLLTLSTVH